MKRTTRFWILILTTLAAIILTTVIPPISQDPAYHLFADQRQELGIPNALNVLSNIPFLFVGIYGLSFLRKSTATSSMKIMYGIIFGGIILTGFGSAFYHYSPDNDTLIFDRIPMTIVFMSLLSAIVAEFISINFGKAILFPLIILGIFSVIWWHITEERGAGDLRLYGFVQYYPVILIPLIILLFQTPQNIKGIKCLVGVVFWYVIAKIAEYFDKLIFAQGGIVSGHTLKHLFAAISIYYIVKMFRQKYYAPVG